MFRRIRTDMYDYALVLAEGIAPKSEKEVVEIDVSDLRDLVCAGIDYGRLAEGSRDMEGLLDWLRGQVIE